MHSYRPDERKPRAETPLFDYPCQHGMDMQWKPRGRLREGLAATIERFERRLSGAEASAAVQLP